MKGKVSSSRWSALNLLAVTALFCAAFQPGRALAASSLTVTPLTWNVIGLDSNNPTAGPHLFPVGVRVCNTGATATDVNVQWVWDSANSYINLRSGSLSSITLVALAAGACKDAYFEVDVAQVPAAYDTTRRYHITATAADTSITVSTPTPRELYVEHLISQSRNGITSYQLSTDGANFTTISSGSSMSLIVGNTYWIRMNGFTATQGYNQLESFINLSNNIFQVLSVQTTYSSNQLPAPLDRPYADSCKWENDPNSPNYRSCTGSDSKAGGSVSITYQVKVLSGGGTTQSFNSLIYDFSGSSYHYNSDFSVGFSIGSIIDPTSAGISKSFTPGTTSVNGVSALTITLTNPNSGTVGGYNFADNLPANMTVANPPNAATSGCGSPTLTAIAGVNSISFSNGTLAGNSSCVITVNVTSSSARTYTNTTQHLFIETLDTGKTGTANLTVSTAPTPPACTPGLELARWTMEPSQGTGVPPTYYVKSSLVSSATALFRPSTTSANPASSIYTGSILGAQPLNYWGGTGWSSSSNQPTDPTTAAAFEFTVDTSRFSNVQISFKAYPDTQWNGTNNNGIYAYSSANGGTFSLIMGDKALQKGNWNSRGPATAATTGTSTTTFLVIGAGQANNPQGFPYMYLDDIVITGCGVPWPPALTKTFTPNPIAVNGISTLRFTLTNENNVALTGVSFTDALPAGLQVAPTPNASTTCGGTPTWAPTAGATTLTFGFPTGATIPARVGTTNGTCTVQVDVKATTAGPHNNVSGYVTSTQTGTNTTSTGSASASLTALLPPSIAKQFAPNPILAGTKSTLTFVITNPNQNDALSGVAIADILPTSPGAMTVASPPNASTSGCGTPTVTAVAGAGSISFSGGTIAGGGTCTVKVDVTVTVTGAYNNASGSVSTIINGAIVSGNTASASLTVNPPHPAIALLKQVSTSLSGPWSSFVAVDPGGSLYYRFTVENIGDVLLQPFSVTDPLVSTAGCIWQTTNTPPTLPALPVGSATVDPTATCVLGPVTAISGSHPNTATAGGLYSGTPVSSTPETATYATTGLTLVKSASESYFTAAGNILHYSYVVQNTGYSPLVAPITVSDDKITGAITCQDPSLATLIAGGAGDGDAFLDPGEQVLCPAAGTADYTVLAADVTAKAVTNTASASAKTTLNATVTSSPASKTVPLAPDLTITKSNDATDGSVAVGASFHWTLLVANSAGAGPASFASGQTLLTDVLPSTGATYLVGTPATSGGTTGAIDCSIAGSTLTCTAGSGGVTIPSGGSFSVPVIVLVTPDAGSSLVNPGTANGCQVDPLGVAPEIQESNNTCADTVTVVRVADLLITKTDGKTTAQPGEILSYVLTVVNNGALTANAVTLADTLPPYLTYVGWSTTDSGITLVSSTNPYSWTLGDLAPGASKSITLQAQVASSLPDGTTTLSNYAKVTTTSAEKDVTNNEVSDVDIVTAHPDLTIAKSFTSTPPATTGSVVTYQLIGGNIGHATATGVTIVDTLDSRATYNDGSATLTISGVVQSPPTTSYDDSTKQLTVTVPSLAPGDSYILTYSVTLGKINGNLPIVNSATIGAMQTDANTANNTASVAVPVQPRPDLYLLKSAIADPNPAAPGGQIVYSLAYGNFGVDPASDVTVTDVLPAHTSFVSASNGGVYDAGTNTVTWNLGTVNGQTGGTVTFTVQIADSLPAGVDTVTNTTNISTSSADTNLTNNTSTVSTPVTAQPDLVIAKTDGLTQVLAGDTLQYILTYQNVGNQAAAGVTIVDRLLNGVVYVSSVPAGTYDSVAGTVTWNIGALAVDGPHTLTLNVTVSSTALPSSVAADRVVIMDDGSNGTDPNPGNNTATDSDLVIAPYIVLEKHASVPSGNPAGVAYTGQQVTYTIDWTNTGATASNVIIQDTLPANTTLVAGSISSPGTESGGVITWNLGSQAAGAGGTVSFAVTVNAGAGGALLTLPTLSTETGSGSLTVTSSSATVPTGSKPWCELDKCAAFKGIYQGADGTPPAGYNDNPRMTAFDDTGWTKPVYQLNGEWDFWEDPASLSAEWVTMHTDAETAGNFSFFRQPFCLPLNATGLSAGLQLAGDDVSDIYLNGVYLGQKIGGGAATPFAASGGIQSGINILAVQLLNNRHGGHPDFDGGDHSGLLFNLGAAYTGLLPFATAPSTVLAGQSVPFAADELAIGGRRPYVYKFDFGDGTVVDYQDMATWSHTYSTPGVYTAVVTARAQYGCTGTDQVVVTVLPADGNLLANPATVTYADANGAEFSGTSGAGVELRRAADLSIVKTIISGGAVPGQGVTYQLVVTNHGPDAAAGASVADTVPAVVTGVTWTCTGAAGGTCAPAGGSGNTINGTVSLPSGATATYTIEGTIDPSATGALANTAAVTPPPGIADLVQGNNSSTASTTLTPTVDLSITKTSNPNPARPGELLTYVITVHNDGPSDAVGATVTDPFPDLLLSPTWTCSATYGSNCTAGGTGSIDDTIYLRIGGTATYTASGMLAAWAAAPLANTATVTPASGTVDGNTGNNSWTDINTPVPTVLSGIVTVDGTPQAGVSVTVVDGAGNSYSTTTGSDGSYSFTGIAVGTATITATYPGAVPATATPTLVVGANTQDLALLTTSVSGVVFYDPDATGVLWPDSLRFEGVTVELLDGAGQVVETTTTAADGSYSFTGLMPGDYSVRVTEPLGYVSTTPNPVPITVVGGTPNVVNFGERTAPTRVLISRFAAQVRDGKVVLEWETAAESATVGFFLYRQDPGSGPPVQINKGIVPSFLGIASGGVYRLVDPGAPPGGTYAYFIQEITARGQTNRYGPFVVKADRPATAASALSGDTEGPYERIPRPASLEVRPAAEAPNTGGGVPEALPDAPDAPGNLPLHVWLPLVLEAYGVADAGQNADIGVPAAASPAPTNPAKLMVRQPGLYYLAATDIAPALGLSVSQVTTLIKTTKLKLTNQGEPVAYLAASGNAGIYLYAEGLHSPYTWDNVYWLQQASGTAMSTLTSKAPAAVALTSFATSSHGEQDVLSVSGQFNDPAADYWMWSYVVAGDANYGARSFALQAGGAVQPAPVSLTAHFLGLTGLGTGVDHHARIVLNGSAIGDAVWAGAAPYDVTLPVDPALLRDGANTVEIIGLLDPGVPFSIFCVNSFDVGYSRVYRALDDRLAFTSLNNQALTVYGFSSSNVMVFDISNPKLPKRVSGLRVEPSGGAYRVTFRPATAGLSYLAVTTTAAPRITTLAADTPSALKGPNGADYVIITTAGLAQPARELAAYRQERGLRAKVVDIQDVYDEFNGGVARPQAIREFLAHAYANWSPPPHYVLLAGAGSFDYRNILGYGDSLVPPILVSTIDVLSAADSRYGDVVGDDGAPEIAIGRLPVLTGAEFQAYIAKIRAYEAADPTGWSKQVLLLADNTDSEAGNFAADSDRVAAGLPSDYTADKIYLGPLSAAQARSRTLAALGAGAGVFNYIGHGGLDVLAAENLLISSDVAGLKNSPKLPFMSAATCAVGDYVEPGYRSLAVLLTLQGDGGAGAVFSPTGSSLNADGVALDLKLFQNLFEGAAVRVGDATRAALAQFTAGGGPRYAADTYNLLGDPAMEMRWR